jgi:hypothetical protein
MKRCLLAAAFLLAGSAVPARADYVVIVANVGQAREIQTQPGTGQPGTPGDTPRPSPFGPGGGDRGRPPGLGGLGGGFGPMGPGDQPAPEVIIDPDAVPIYVTAIFELKDKVSAQQLKQFESGRPIVVTHRWGKSYVMKGQPGNWLQIEIIQTPDKETLSSQFNAQKDIAYPKGKATPDAEAVLKLADWCLQHGLLTNFAEVMDKFAKDDPSHPASSAYTKMKAETAKSLPNPKPDAARSRLLDGYKTSVSDHYIAYYNRTEEPPEVKTRLTRLEDNFKSYYYWFALRGVQLPVPHERLPVVVTFNKDDKEDNFAHLADELTAAPTDNVSAFVGRREGLAVFAARRRDHLYQMLEQSTAQYWAQVNRNDVLQKGDTALPRDMEATTRLDVMGSALLMAVMEKDAERATSTHEGTRQLLYASRVLPAAHVVVPEWLQFGAGSFFETPSGSPWVSTGAPSAEYLPLWRDLKAKAKRDKVPWSPSETLKMVVTDGYFRLAKMDGDLGSLRRARATSWALIYYLAHENKLDGPKPNMEAFQKYCKELAKMPRDMELSDEVLLHTFCKAFGLLGPDGQVNQAAFDKFANRWDTAMDQERLEMESVVRGIRSYIAKQTTAQEGVKKPGDPNFRPGGPGGGGPIGPGGGPIGPGGRPIGPGGGPIGPGGRPIGPGIGPAPPPSGPGGIRPGGS